jgi:hypothetical protein
MLQHNIRHLLVVDNKIDTNKPIGVVTPKDLTRYQEFTRDDTNQSVLEKIFEYYI